MANIYRPSPDQLDIMQWSVEQWDDPDNEVERLISIALNPTIALAAFAAAVVEWPDKRLTCRHGSRLLGKHVPERLRVAAGGLK
jgi:hypothetical protein